VLHSFALIENTEFSGRSIIVRNLGVDMDNSLEISGQTEFLNALPEGACLAFSRFSKPVVEFNEFRLCRLNL
jgi:hypothetical protein